MESIGSFAAVLVMFVALGVFAPRVVPWLADWRSARKGLTQLDELWTDLTATYPTAVLPSGGGVGHRVEFAFDRRLVEISECLRLAHLPATAAEAVRDASDHVAEALAVELYRCRAHWASGHGPVAADPSAAGHVPGRGNRRSPRTRRPLRHRITCPDLRGGELTCRPGPPSEQPAWTRSGWLRS